MGSDDEKLRKVWRANQKGISDKSQCQIIMLCVVFAVMLVMGGVKAEEPHVRRGARVLASVAYFNVISRQTRRE